MNKELKELISLVPDEGSVTEAIKQFYNADFVFLGRYSSVKGNSITVTVDGVKLFLEEV